MLPISIQNKKMSHIVITLITFYMVAVLVNSVPIPRPDLKSAVMDKLHKIPELLKSAIPMPKKIKMTLDIDNRETEPVSSGGSEVAASRRDFDNGHHDDSYGSSNNNNHNNSSPTLHSTNIMIMVLISIAVFIIGTSFVLTLWCCFRKKNNNNHIIKTKIVTSPNSTTEMTTMRSYNNQSKEKECLHFPNVQKMISDLNRK